jgi:Fe-S cluster assembly protein SufD
MNRLESPELEFMENIARASANNVSTVEAINQAQAIANQKLHNSSFPSKKDEAWKYYDFRDILDPDFINISSPTQSKSQLNIAELIDKYVFKETAETLIVTYNGVFRPELSNFKNLREGLTITNFSNSAELEKNPKAYELLKKYFAKNIKEENNYFSLVNTSLINNGFLLAVDDNHQLNKTVQVLHLSDKNEFSQIRSLIYAGKNSKLDLLVTYVGLKGTKYLKNSVVEVFLDCGAQLKLEKIQNESKEATILYNFYAQLERDSKLEFDSFSFGAKSSRKDLTIDIVGSNAHASVNGLYVVNGSRKSHQKIKINHLAPHSTSNQMFKGLLDDSSKAEFNGLINVAKGAFQTDSTQLNKNLLLSEKAHIDSRPQLNILNDDVKCSHGSTVGNLDEEQLFYLESRGLSSEGARAILTYSFCQELIKRISIESARNYASNLAFANISKQEEGSLIFSTLAENSKFKRYRVENVD